MRSGFGSTFVFILPPHFIRRCTQVDARGDFRDSAQKYVKLVTVNPSPRSDRTYAVRFLAKPQSNKNASAPAPSAMSVVATIKSLTVNLGLSPDE